MSDVSRLLIKELECAARDGNQRHHADVEALRAQCQQQARALAQYEAARTSLLQGVKARIPALKGTHEGWHNVYRLLQERASLLESGAYGRASTVVQQVEAAVFLELDQLVTLDGPAALQHASR